MWVILRKSSPKKLFAKCSVCQDKRALKAAFRAQSRSRMMTWLPEGSEE